MSHQPRTQRTRLSSGIRSWMIALNNFPGWTDWVRRRVAFTLLDEDIRTKLPKTAIEMEFVFPPTLNKQHAVVLQYMGLLQTVETLKECEYYFRRYPFRGLPISRANHITNVCEMYFARFYELKERLKNYFEAVKVVSPNHRLEIGKFIRLYEREFDHELRERHNVHHRSRFEDAAIDRVFLVDTTNDGRDDQEHSIRYRKLTKEWVNRVRRRAARVDVFMEAVADATLRTCSFLALYSLMATVAEFRGVEWPKRRQIRRRRSTIAARRG
jgi:hypothetical protein